MNKTVKIILEIIAAICAGLDYYVKLISKKIDGKRTT